MLYFDLHCDTLTTSLALGQGLWNNRLQVSAERLAELPWCQCFVLWLDDDLPREQRPAFMEAALTHFRQQLTPDSPLIQARTAADVRRITAQGRVAAILTVENAALVEDDLSLIAQLAEAGVRMMTLSWNQKNRLAGGQLSDGGLTPLGEEALQLLEQHDIIADLSHLNDQSFWAVLEHTRRPVLASHSCCRSVHHHLRNLTDEQIRAIAQRGGVVGTTFYHLFLGGEQPDYDTLCSHLEQLLRVGGETLPALGSDYDGGVDSTIFAGCQIAPRLYDCLVGRFGSRLADRFMGQNALDFLERYENM